MAAVSLLVRVVAGMSVVILAACETMPSGPGSAVDAANTSIKFTHPLYPSAAGEYTQRSGGHNSQLETATFFGKTGIVFVAYNHSSGDTYISSSNVKRIVENFGSTPEKNEIKASGTLPNTFPVVEWVSYSAMGDGGVPASCVSIQRNGNSAGSFSSYTTAVINATECRGAYMTMTEREAAMLSGSVRIE